MENMRTHLIDKFIVAPTDAAVDPFVAKIVEVDDVCGEDGVVTLILARRLDKDLLFTLTFDDIAGLYIFPLEDAAREHCEFVRKLTRERGGPAPGTSCH